MLDVIWEGKKVAFGNLGGRPGGMRGWGGSLFLGFFEARDSDKIQSTRPVCLWQGAVYSTDAAHSARPDLVNTKSGCLMIYHVFYSMALFVLLDGFISLAGLV